MLWLGNWADLDDRVDLDERIRLIQAYDCTCQYCGMKTVLTSKSPMGYFNLYLKDQSLPSEPRNWVPICDMCSNLNSLEKLKGKGNLIEATWCTQSELINLVRLAYLTDAIEGLDWGKLKSASYDMCLNYINKIPEEWSTYNWDGRIENIKDMSDDFRLFFDKRAYINKLRFVYSPEPFKEALEYWAPYIHNTYKKNFLDVSGEIE